MAMLPQVVNTAHGCRAFTEHPHHSTPFFLEVLQAQTLIPVAAGEHLLLAQGMLTQAEQLYI